MPSSNSSDDDQIGVEIKKMDENKLSSTAETSQPNKTGNKPSL